MLQGRYAQELWVVRHDWAVGTPAVAVCFREMCPGDRGAELGKERHRNQQVAGWWRILAPSLPWPGRFAEKSRLCLGYFFQKSPDTNKVGGFAVGCQRLTSAKEEARPWGRCLT